MSEGTGGKKYRFAIVGCGRIAPKHVEAITQIKNAELVAVCDIKEARAIQYGEKFKIPHFTDYHVMMRKVPDIDVVNILTPSGLHDTHCIEIAAYKPRAIVVEKPMCLTLEGADRMIETCDKNGVRLFVVKQNRFNLPVKKLKEALDKGRFGKLILGTVRVRWARYQQYYDQDEWRGTWRYDGGVIANQADHYVDMLRWTMGEVESVVAKAGTYLASIETEDTCVAIVKFTSGALGVIEATTATRPKDLEGSISILGEKGSVVIGGFSCNEMKTWNFTEPEPGDEEVLEKYKTNPPNVYGYGHIEYLENVLKAIEDNTRGMVDGLEGRKALEFVLAIYESIEREEEVFVNFRTKKCRLGRAI